MTSEALGIFTEIASTNTHRVKKYSRQRVARDLLPEETRLSQCHNRPLRGDKVQVFYNPQTGKAFYKNILVCGCVWTCPVCAAKVTERKKQEILWAVKNWKGSIIPSSFTFSHNKHQKLETLIKVFSKIWRSLKSGRWWKEFLERYQIEGDIFSVEETVSILFGWHPHKHGLFFSRLPAGSIDTNKMQEDLYQQFSRLMAKEGIYVSKIYGVRVEKALDAQIEAAKAASYIAKWGLADELAKGPTKTGKTEDGVIHYSPFDLLDLADQGDEQAKAWFIEYAKAMKGKRQISWSRGLRTLLKLAEEKTDLELAEEEVTPGADLSIELDRPEYKFIFSKNYRGQFLNLVESVRGDSQAIAAILRSLMNAPP